MRIAVFPLVGAVLVAAAVAAAAEPDTLVIKGADGKYAAGAAQSWTSSGATSVSFVLAEGVDANAVAKLLTERLATAKVKLIGGKLEVRGIPVEALLDQLSSLSLTGDGDDPLADLAGLGTVVAMDTPEGGGSIRASKPTTTFGPRVIKDHDPSERLTAQVVEVKRGAFPMVSLRLKLKSVPKAGPFAQQLKKGKVIDGDVVLQGDSGAVDFQAAASQRNLAAYYLVPGDQVTVHAAAAEGELFEIDFVERAKK
jgi:hypothetical protein